MEATKYVLVVPVMAAIVLLSSRNYKGLIVTSILHFAIPCITLIASSLLFG